MFRDQSRDSGFADDSTGAPDVADRLRQDAPADLNQALKPPRLAREHLITKLHSAASAGLEACALALYDAGFGRQPTTADARLPGQWVVEALQASLSLRTDRRPHSKRDGLSVYIGPDENGRGDEAYLYVGASQTDFMVDALPLLMKVRAEAPALELWLARALNGASSWLAGPHVYLDILRRFYWEGEDDEAQAKQMYLDEGEEWAGITRAEFDAVYPRSFHDLGGMSDQRQGRLFKAATQADLKSLREGKATLAPLIDKILAMLRASRRVSVARNLAAALWADPWELGYEDWFSFRRGIHFGDEDMSQILIDEAYNMALQCSYCEHHTIYRLPTNAKEARALVCALRAIRDEFHATEALVEEMEKA